MLLAIDVGNTHTVAGLYDGVELLSHWRIKTVAASTDDEIATCYTQLLTLGGYEPRLVDQVVVSSVVPALSHAYGSFAERYLQCSALVVGSTTDTGVELRTETPAEVGADRIVNVAAAWQRYRRCCIVIDLGTATTFDAVSSDGAFLGGAIAPGLGTSFEALVARAAQLAAVELVVPARAIGTNTVTNVQSGTVFGVICLLEGMIRRFRGELDVPDAPAIATGGFSARLEGYVDGLDAVDPLLTLRGLQIVAARNCTTGR